MNKMLNGFQMKMLGVVTMVIDHLAEFFSFLGVPLWFHWIGRIAAPIFLFESSEGFVYTRNRKKYMLRLLYGFWIMGIANQILNTYFSVDNEIVLNNIFETLFLGTIYMLSVDYFKAGFKHKKGKDIAKGLLVFLLPIVASVIPFLGILIAPGNQIAGRITQILSILIPSLLTTEGSVVFVLLAVLFYLFHGKKFWQIASLLFIALLNLVLGSGNPFTENYQWMMIIAAVPIILYNGEKGRSMRNFFYYFYPLHIIAFAIISFFLRQ
ncbi:TraX family protein [Enterococcus sp. LJL120]